MPADDYVSSGPWRWLVESLDPPSVHAGEAADLRGAVADVCFLSSSMAAHVLNVTDAHGVLIFWQMRLERGWMRTFVTDEIVALWEADADSQEDVLALGLMIAESRHQLAMSRGET